MSDELPPDLMMKWILGDLGPEDARALDAWVAADPARRTELEEMRQLWRMAGEVAEARAAAPDPEEQGRWARLARAMREQDQASLPPAHARFGPRLVHTIELPFVGGRSRGWGWVAAAAAAAALVTGGEWWTRTHARAHAAEAVRPMRVYETTRGERAEFRLSDGTRVMLNVASRVEVPADYGQRDRVVHLRGGAYFEVVHNQQRPFAVYAGDMVARDLGTEFTIGAYPEDHRTQVVAGQVALAAAVDSTRSVTVSPGQRGQLDGAGRPVVDKVDTAMAFAWTGGTLVLDGTPLRDALVQLGRWFDLDFRLADSSLGGIPVAATLTNQPTDQALDFLAGSLGLRATRDGRVVTLHSSRR